MLEIARSYKSLPQPRHSIIFLINDGEEAGLLGARVLSTNIPGLKTSAPSSTLTAAGRPAPV